MGGADDRAEDPAARSPGPAASDGAARDPAAAAAGLEAEATSVGSRGGDAAWPCRRLLEAATLRLEAGEPAAAEALVKRAAAALAEARSRRAREEGGLAVAGTAAATAGTAATAAAAAGTAAAPEPLAAASPLGAAGPAFPCADQLEQLEVRYRELSAASAEAQGRFAEAGGHWHALSRSRPSSRREPSLGAGALAWEAAQHAALAAAARCALSARPGALRTRLVAALLEDRRTASPAFVRAAARAALAGKTLAGAAVRDGPAVAMCVDGAGEGSILGDGSAGEEEPFLCTDDGAEEGPVSAEALRSPWMLRLLELVSREQFLGPPESIALLRASLPTYVRRPEAVDEALLEHNVLAASNVFTSTSIASLTALLGTRDDRETEAAVARAALEGRVDARIDQLDGMVAFARPASGREAWNERVGALCAAADEAARYAREKGYA